MMIALREAIDKGMIGTVTELEISLSVELHGIFGHS